MNKGCRDEHLFNEHRRTNRCHDFSIVRQTLKVEHVHVLCRVQSSISTSNICCLSNMLDNEHVVCSRAPVDNYNPRNCRRCSRRVELSTRVNQIHFIFVSHTITVSFVIA
jgi:hypothetical protein